ncbi:PA2169 family four-helix-bundle protein [Aquimarina addita]
MNTTTREDVKMESHKNLVNVLQGLLEKNYDAEEGFKKVMIETDHAGLTSFLQLRARERSQFATELTDKIISLNEEPIKSGSFSGTLHRAWISIKTTISGDKNEAILEECINGEKEILAEYDKALENNYFTEDVKNMLLNQRESINKVLNTVKKLEDLI